MEEGYIKYQCNWKRKNISVPSHVLDEMNTIRDQLVQLNMIGKIPGGPGFGNLSLRIDEHLFVISGTNTGHFKKLKLEHLSLVTHVDVQKNTVYCEGETQASSESMTHAAILKINPEANAVIHIHHNKLWQHLLHKHPTTPESVEYGTPELAKAVIELSKNTTKDELLVLGGHKDGIISFGADMNYALSKILRVYNELQ